MDNAYTQFTVILAGLFLIGAVGMLIYLRAISATLPTAQEAVGSVSSEVPEVTPSPSSTPRADIPQGWLTYTSTNHNFSISRPADVRVQQGAGNIIQLTKTGRTQKQGVQITDGYSLMLNSGSLENLSLETYTQKQRELLVQSIPGDLSDVSQITFKDYTGYEFSQTNPHSRQYIYLPLNNNRYLEIITDIVDPNKQKYEEEVQNILDTLNIIM